MQNRSALRVCWLESAWVLAALDCTPPGRGKSQAIEHNRALPKVGQSLRRAALGGLPLRALRVRVMVGYVLRPSPDKGYVGALRGSSQCYAPVAYAQPWGRASAPVGVGAGRRCWWSDDVEPTAANQMPACVINSAMLMPKAAATFWILISATLCSPRSMPPMYERSRRPYHRLTA